MKVGEILQRLTEGEKIGDIADQLGLDKSTVRRKLKRFGYEYNNSQKFWYFDGKGEAPTDQSIFTANDQEKGKGKSSMKPQQQPTEQKKSCFDVSFVERIAEHYKEEMIEKGIFTEEQIDVLASTARHQNQAILQAIDGIANEFMNRFGNQYIAQKQQPKKEKTTEVPVPLFDRIRSLPEENKTRKTIVIHDSISKDLDEFAKQQKLNKSDLIHIALKELFEKEGFYKKDQD